jgi:chitinase
MKKMIVGLMMVLLLAGCSDLIDSKYSEQRVMLSYFRGDRPLEEIEFEKFTHLCHMGVQPDVDGSISVSHTAPDSAFSDKCSENNVVPLLTFTNKHLEDETDVFETISSDLFLCRKFCRYAAVFAVDHGYKGLDIDWEHPVNDKQIKGWNTLMRMLKEELAKLSEVTGTYYWLTTALPDWGPGIADADTVKNYIDFINIMTYDGMGPWGGKAANTAPLFGDSEDPDKYGMATKVYSWIEKFGADKIVFGLPFYGYSCYGYQPYDIIDKEDSTKSVDGGIGWNTAAAREADGWVKVKRPAVKPEGEKFPEEVFSSWYFKDITHPEQGFVACDDAEVISMKTRWAKFYKMRGVFYWSLNLDRLGDGSTPLLEAAYNAWPVE